MVRIEQGALLLLCSALLLLLVPTCQAGDFAFRIDTLFVTGPRCIDLDSGAVEEWVWKFSIGATGAQKCFFMPTVTSTNPSWNMYFSTPRKDVQVELEAFEKDSAGDTCSYVLGTDDPDHRVLENKLFTIDNITEGGSSPWAWSVKIPDTDCFMRANGTILRFSSEATIIPFFAVDAEKMA